MRKLGISSFGAGLLMIVIVAVAAWFVFTKSNPFANPYELSAVFGDAQNLKPGSPVRTAGVDVGQVKSIEAMDDGSGAALVKMEVDAAGLPIHEDAELKVQPRLFLEGNFVVDLRPGSPSAPELDSGETVPMGQTANSVSLGEVLKVFQKDTRRSLRTTLDELGRGLGGGGAEGFNRSVEYWEEAYRTTALATQALRGQEPGEDLPQVLSGQQRTFAALDENPAELQELVTDLNTTTAAFAREDVALQASIPALRDVLRVSEPALSSLEAALPSLSAFSEDALPGVRTLGPTIDVSLPFIRQLRLLFRPSELRGTAAELRQTVPPLARLNRTLPSLLEQTRRFGSCATNVLIPWGASTIPDPDFPENRGPVYRQAPRSLVGLASESRIGDANGQMFRVLAGGGPNTAVQTGPGNEGALFAQTPFPSLGVRPAPPARRPQFRPDVPCETQDPPNLNAPRAFGDPSVDPSPASSVLSGAGDALPLPARRSRLRRGAASTARRVTRERRGGDPAGSFQLGFDPRQRKKGARP